MAKSDNPFRWFDSSPEVIQMVVMLYVRFPQSLRNVEDLALERGVDICHETVRKWVNRFGPTFASKIRAGTGRLTSQAARRRIPTLDQAATVASAQAS